MAALGTPYRLWYQDTTNDPHHGNYTEVFAAFNNPFNNPTQQLAPIRNLVFATGNQGSQNHFAGFYCVSHHLNCWAVVWDSCEQPPRQMSF
mmetsp:Transcript_13713/g.25713  ORF Transcript_13713/g.25713 Transcript_13713/m.25713 type:complete len:91 (+) Transcript_13713:103-375(+)